MNLVLLWVLVGFQYSCASQEEIIFAEDFEQPNISLFDTTQVITFNGERILGNFNNEKVTFTLNGIGRHQLVTISFDLFIHDSWDGNSSGVNGPDVWVLEVGKSDKKLDRIKTSFSNSSCNSAICLLQSYPQVFPYPNDPKTGAVRSKEGICHFKSQQSGTTIYRLSYTFIHSDKTLLVNMFDELVQLNTETPKCDESWSIDNLIVSVS